MIYKRISSGDRRKSPDFWARLIVGVNLVAWGILIAAMAVFHRARPEFESFFDRYYNRDLRTFWDIHFLNYLLYIILTGFVISIFGLVLTRFRARRESDLKTSVRVIFLLYILLTAAAVMLNMKGGL